MNAGKDLPAQRRKKCEKRSSERSSSPPHSSGGAFLIPRDRLIYLRPQTTKCVWYKLRSWRLHDRTPGSTALPGAAISAQLQLLPRRSGTGEVDHEGIPAQQQMRHGLYGQGHVCPLSPPYPCLSGGNDRYRGFGIPAAQPLGSAGARCPPRLCSRFGPKLRQYFHPISATIIP